ncbi:hypothetical protein [Pseudocitrobacter sp. 73]|uniref:hypothetical protein n=1 Tax=Pseudocitrobacter sp. 73 TaxID=2605731 RepID=UPI0011EC6917|nr:hypothetical protein [Pseudocitrobacter sp. 73]KAA1047292.1 hypothetical protein F0Q32_20460 [Pseudocitrobacter sp. 73]
MWREAKLAFTDSIAALDCSVVPVHPWVYGLGQQTENGDYLSPVNAVKYMADKLASVGGSADVMIMMVTAQTQEAFMSNLSQLVDVFPAPAFTQVKRLAQSAAQLAAEKMQIPSGFGDALPAAIPLSVVTSRSALAAAEISDAKKAAAAAVDMMGLKKHLAEFSGLRDLLLKEVEDSLGNLQGKSAKAWVFTSDGDLTATLLELVKNIPLQSAVYTAGVMLVGDNLQGIKGMIHELDTDTGA